jgi:hypothetical protein
MVLGSGASGGARNDAACGKLMRRGRVWHRFCAPARRAPAHPPASKNSNKNVICTRILLAVVSLYVKYRTTAGVGAEEAWRSVTRKKSRRAALRARHSMLRLEEDEHRHISVCAW